MEKYVGFYTSKPFWMGNKPDLSKFGSQYYITPEFYDLMSEIVFKFKKGAYEVFICKDGMIMLSKCFKEELEIKEKWRNYLTILNSIYLLFESAVLKIQNFAAFEISEITNKDAFGISLEDGKMVGQSVPMFSYAEKYVNGRFLGTYDGNNPSWQLFDPRLSFRCEIILDVLEEFSKSLDLLFSNEEMANFQILSDLTKSLGEYKIMNYETSLVLAWFIIEKYINVFWDRFLESNKELIYEKRKKGLKDHRTYIVAVKLEILQFNNVISLDEFKKINEIRTLRNDIVHINKKKDVRDEDCAAAFNVIKEFIKKEMKIELEINSGYTFSGI